MLKITHNAGFFSCCTVRLCHIVNYFNINKKLPDVVDTSQSFQMYKPITMINDVADIKYNNIINIGDNQFANYKEISNFDEINMFMNKYFQPSDEINTIVNDIQTEYNLNYDNICVLFYRGNDKNRETLICGYDEYIEKAKTILLDSPNIKFLIQSDETQFIERMLDVFPNNSFIFKNRIRHVRKCNNTVDIIMSKQNFIYSKYYLAITIIMSKCKYIICGSGNCSIWIIYYRGNAENVYQNLDHKWLS